MEKLELKSFWKNKRVLITGHTGFKGSWLLHWLIKKDAKVFGYSLDNINTDSLYYKIKKKYKFKNKISNILSINVLENYVKLANPDIVFHLAAQPLVRESYINPIKTWNVNTIGTVNLLNSLSVVKKKCSVVFVTTDKVYENIYRNNHSFRETDRLGGVDPYSASKSASELAISSWIKAFPKNNLNIASARAGNVLGGGDWAKDRLLPDIIKSLERKKTIVIRNPKSIRPWQHVLDCIYGYLKLAEFLYTSKNSQKYSAFNIGPNKKDLINVEELVKLVMKHWPGEWKVKKMNDNKHEAQTIFLNNMRAKRVLKWKPLLNNEQTVNMTINWYKNKKNGFDFSSNDIDEYENLLIKLK